MSVHLADWPQAEPRVLPLRLTVFVREQGVPEEMERDADDAHSRHGWIEEADGAVVACGRLLPDGHIGRLAVRSDRRGRGLGTRMLQALIDEARRQGMDEVVLHAQCTAEGFYARHGFAAEGAVFIEAGLAHRVMRLPLSPPA